MYIYIEPIVAPEEGDLLTVSCEECGASYELPVDTWLDISISGTVACECGNFIRIKYPPLEEAIH
jgi:hypothetical protein